MLADGVSRRPNSIFSAPMGCDQAQGLRFGEPLSEEKVAALIMTLRKGRLTPPIPCGKTPPCFSGKYCLVYMAACLPQCSSSNSVF
jgi:hypothetical protein